MNLEKNVHLIRKWYRVSGKVQDLGFRRFIADTAFSIDITGWVRNDSDGSIELEAQGEENQLEQLLYNLEEGPCYAEVHGVQSKKRPVVNSEKSFIIRK